MVVAVTGKVTAVSMSGASTKVPSLVLPSTGENVLELEDVRVEGDQLAGAELDGVFVVELDCPTAAMIETGARMTGGC